ncbi:unnamed protein product, partial [Urochloa humidicola]
FIPFPSHFPLRSSPPLHSPATPPPLRSRRDLLPLTPCAPMAVDEVVLEVHPQQPAQPPLEPAAAALPILTVPKFLQYLYLASAWVACAGVAAATVARRALGDDSPVTYTLLKVSFGALAFPVLLVVLVTLRLVRAMCAAGFGASLRTFTREVQIQSRKARI